MRKGISPVIATVIIVAVAIAIAIAVAGWLMGLWGAYGKYESVHILPDSYIETGNNSILHLHLKNDGNSEALIYKVVVNGEEHNETIALAPGQDATINITLTGTYQPGAIYTVTVYTASGSVITASIPAR